MRPDIQRHVKSSVQGVLWDYSHSQGFRRAKAMTCCSLSLPAVAEVGEAHSVWEGLMGEALKKSLYR